jgi:hypothetical protein
MMILEEVKNPANSESECKKGSGASNLRPAVNTHARIPRHWSNALANTSVSPTQRMQPSTDSAVPARYTRYRQAAKDGERD